MIKNVESVRMIPNDIEIVDYEFNGVEYLVVLQKHFDQFKLNQSNLESRIQNLKELNIDSFQEEYALLELKRLNSRENILMELKSLNKQLLMFLSQ